MPLSSAWAPAPAMASKRHYPHDCPTRFDFPFQDATLFRGLEHLPELLTDPRSLRESYMEELTKHLGELRRGCRAQQVV